MGKILTIDDDKMTHRFVARALQDEFELLQAMDGETGIHMALESEPDIILLDVEMPGLNGYEVCDRLKHEQSINDIPVVFLSGRGNLREVLLGYEAGGADYIVKPFEAAALNAKLKVILDNVKRSGSLRQEINNIGQTAHIAMTTSAELGRVIQFVEQCFEIYTFDNLGLATLQICHELQLKTCIMIKTEPEVFWYGHSGMVSPMEMEVINLLRERERINNFGCRTVINYPNVSLMVKNMPIDDPERYGRIKDLVPAILSTLNSKIDALNREEGIRVTSLDLAETFERTGTTLSRLFTEGQESREAVKNIQTEMFNTIQSKLPYMGLDEDQENFILSEMDESIQAVREIEDRAEKTSADITEIISELGRLGDIQKNLTRDNHFTEGALDQIPCDDDDEMNSVELF